ncbi:hypothetical protein PCH_Pc12g01600 [Penicillium rubens Wisconsin 54-1255]|uniref:Uncharacterized protein n=1 Tax=Penicillium rubens (strain ATCC 28089 / DSM 1075 / NRRL 1951 / Wisconsin 54-1255) TaxID=500485 RepID=B6GZ33_PENRW|nr:hypothetical protein PCH_Pc12g01600 [Penicillium rubens Wisconsin 54-1255]
MGDTLYKNDRFKHLHFHTVGSDKTGDIACSASLCSKLFCLPALIFHRGSPSLEKQIGISVFERLDLARLRRARMEIGFLVSVSGCIGSFGMAIAMVRRLDQACLKKDPRSMVEMALYFYSNIYLTVKIIINGIQGNKAANALGIILQDRGQRECEPREDRSVTESLLASGIMTRSSGPPKLWSSSRQGKVLSLPSTWSEDNVQGGNGSFLLVLRGQQKKLFLLLEHLALRYQSCRSLGAREPSNRSH